MSFNVLWGKRFAGDLFVLYYNSQDSEKKILTPYIYNASNEGPFFNSPRNVINSKFP